jgi:hypothetical protein
MFIRPALVMVVAAIRAAVTRAAVIPVAVTTMTTATTVRVVGYVRTARIR